MSQFDEYSLIIWAFDGKFHKSVVGKEVLESAAPLTYRTRTSLVVGPFEFSFAFLRCSMCVRMKYENTFEKLHFLHHSALAFGFSQLSSLLSVELEIKIFAENLENNMFYLRLKTN